MILMIREKKKEKKKKERKKEKKKVIPAWHWQVYNLNPNIGNPTTGYT